MQSSDASPEAAPFDAGPKDAGADWGAPDVDAARGEDAAEAGPDALLACGELPVRDLRSVEEVKAALLASPAFPFPGGWGPCTLPSLTICPQGSGDISFDSTATSIQCGGNFESGFHTHADFAMVIADTGAKTPSGAPIFELQVTAEAGVKHYQVAAQGQPGGKVGIELFDPESGLQAAWVKFEPLIPLP